MAETLLHSIFHWDPGGKPEAVLTVKKKKIILDDIIQLTRKRVTPRLKKKKKGFSKL